MSFKRGGACAFTRIGASHIRAGKACQDASGAFSGCGYSAIAVCDGHGGDKHFRSAVGSAIAVDVCRETVEKFAAEILKNNDYGFSCEQTVRQLGKSIVLLWRERVTAHLNATPFLSEETALLSPSDLTKVTENGFIAYGTTCLLAFVCGKRLYLLQLGDGDVRLVSARGIVSPMSEDSRLQFNVTTSLCDGNAFENMRLCVLPLRGVKGCWLSSDGVRNSFCNEDGFIGFIKTVKREFRRKRFSVFSDEINGFLPALSKRGSGDDVSVAYMRI